MPAIGPAAAGSLTPAFEAAVERDATVQALVARRAEIAAELNATAYLIPEPPSFSIGYLSDWPARNIGFREYEAELSAPLWLPGEQGAALESVEAAAAKLEADIDVARLEVAGALRAGYWDLEAARQALTLAERKRDTARALVEDTARQVGAGRVARVALHLAEADLHEAEAFVSERRADLGAAFASFHELTGVEPPDSFAESVAGEAFPTDHPRLRAMKWAGERAKAEFRRARVGVVEPPEVALVARSEREDHEDRFNTSLGFRVTIPFVSAGQTRPRRAAAVADHSAALAELGASEREIRADLERARIALDSARRQFAALDQRIAALEAVVVLTEQSYRVGEAPIVEVIRARAALFEAENARVGARIAEARALSDINQALGVEP